MPHGIRGLRSHREVSVVSITLCIIVVMSADWEMIHEMQHRIQWPKATRHLHKLKCSTKFPGCIGRRPSGWKMVME